MRSLKRLIVASAAAALVVGVAAAAATPAQAAHNPKYDTTRGKMSVSISPGYTSQAAKDAQLTFASKKPKSTEDASTGYLNLNAKVTGTPADGAIATTGTWQIKSALTGQTISIVNPFFGYATGATDNEYEGAISGVIRGLTAPYRYLNGRSETVFDLKDVRSAVVWKKTKAIPGGYTRVATTTTTAMAHVTKDNNVLAAFDSTIGSPWFQGGEMFGMASVVVKVTHSCKTKKECNNLD